jgi:sporulation protein YlmC with PRC-barrel domain
VTGSPSSTGPTGRTPDPSGRGGRRLDAVLHLLDRQLLDRNGRMAGKVDDLELAPNEDGALVVTGILTGPGALGPRLPRWLGRRMVAVWSTIKHVPPREPNRIDYALISKIETAITVAADREDLPTRPLEAWVRDHLIDKLPGAQHDPE